MPSVSTTRKVASSKRSPCPSSLPRKTFPNLEKSKFMDKSTFDEFSTKRGKKSLRQVDRHGTEVGEKIVGKFKGWIEITDKTLLEKNKLNSLLPGISAKRSFSSISVETRKKDNNIDKEFMEKTPVVIRVCILKAFSLAHNSPSDPYLKIRLGEQVQDNQKEY